MSENVYATQTKEGQFLHPQHAGLHILASRTKVKEELSARAIIQHEEQFVRGLEGAFEAHNERVTHVAQHAPLGASVLYLVSSHDVVFPKHL